MTQSTTIPVAFIKEFQKRARHIKPRNVLPIVKYLLFEWGEAQATGEDTPVTPMSLTKTAIESYVHYTTGPCTRAMLIEESKLYELASTADTISVTSALIPETAGDPNTEQYTVTLKAGKIISNRPAPHVKTFPNHSTPENEPYELDGDTIDTILTASNFMCRDDSDLREWMKAVHLNQYGVQATNAVKIYYKDGTHPLYHLPIEAVTAMAGSLFVSLSQTDNYLFMVSNGATYGFAKKEFIMHNDVGVQVRKMEHGSTATFDKAPVLQFLNILPARDSTGGMPLVKLTFSGTVLKIWYIDDRMGEDDSVTVDCVCQGVCMERTFNADYLRTVLQYSTGNTLTLLTNHLAIFDGNECCFTAGIS